MKSYLITDPAFYSSDPTLFEYRLAQAYRKYVPDMVCFRDKVSKNFKELAEVFVRVSRRFAVPMVLIHNDIDLACTLEADGVHLPSSRLEEVSAAKSRGLYVIGSVHNIEEAGAVQRLGGDAVTYSPIFDTPHKGMPQGLEKLKEIVDKINIDVYALGGIITRDHVKRIAEAGVAGFASIRYFIYEEVRSENKE